VGTTRWLLLLSLLAAGCAPVLRGDPPDDDDSGWEGVPDDDDSLDDDDTTDDDDLAPDDDDSAPSSPCDDSPLIGDWAGDFDGFIESTYTGPMWVVGTMNYTISCTDRLVLEGQMIGADSVYGVPFEATVVGEYSEAANQLTAAVFGTVSGFVPFEGEMEGQVTAWDPLQMGGGWSAEAPSAQGTGDGSWQASM